VLTEHDRRMPLDADPYIGHDPRGLFVLRERGTRALATTPDAFTDEPLYRSHFVTCPQRDTWRRNRAG